MPTKRFIIAPIETGLQNNVKPWLIPDDAFETLKNAYVYRGRLRKRFGSRLMDQKVANPQFSSRLRVNIGTTNAAGNTAAPLAVPGIYTNAQRVGQLFSCGDVFFTVTAAGATLAGAPTRATTATGAYVFGGPTFAIAGGDAALDTLSVFFYPAQPVMALLTLETDIINDDKIIAFDTQFAYEYVAGGWQRLALETNPGDAIWTGSDSQFFWGATYYGTTFADNRFFVVNFQRADGIRNLDFVANLQLSPWEKVNYTTTVGDTLDSAKIIFVFKNRLIALNTLETVAAAPLNFGSRARYSQIGDLVSAANTFAELPGQGSFLDAPTKEVIVSARIIKDRLIVYFERSTWELVYLGNQANPFAWQKINSELGAESTFSSVVFDGDIVSVGNVGIHACNGAYVQRIDEKIPELVFDVHNEESGVERVYGIRDFEAEVIYWTFPRAGRAPSDKDSKFPSQVLVFNYKNGSWALNDDTITCFGYYQLQDDLTWESITETWEGYDEPWVSGDFQALTRAVLAGNQEGFTFVVNKDLARNAPALQITNILAPVSRPRLTIIAHNFIVGEFIRVEGCIGNTLLNDKNYEIVEIVDADNIEVVEPTFTLPPAYIGGGTITRISKIDIQTREFNFFIQQGMKVSVPRVDFLVDRTGEGEITIDIRPSSSTLSVNTFTLETKPYDLYPLEATQDRLWHPVYTQLEGTGAQLRIYLSDAQMLNFNIIRADFQLGAMIFYATPSSSRLEG